MNFIELHVISMERRIKGVWIKLPDSVAGPVTIQDSLIKTVRVDAEGRTVVRSKETKMYVKETYLHVQGLLQARYLRPIEPTPAPKSLDEENP